MRCEDVSQLLLGVNAVSGVQGFAQFSLYVRVLSTYMSALPNSPPVHRPVWLLM